MAADGEDVGVGLVVISLMLTALEVDAEIDGDDIDVKVGVVPTGDDAALRDVLGRTELEVIGASEGVGVSETRVGVATGVDVGLSEMLGRAEAEDNDVAEDEIVADVVGAADVTLPGRTEEDVTGYVRISDVEVGVLGGTEVGLREAEADAEDVSAGGCVSEDGEGNVDRETDVELVEGLGGADGDDSTGADAEAAVDRGTERLVVSEIGTTEVEGGRDAEVGASVVGVPGLERFRRASWATDQPV
jgi:hypothetical protein